MAAHIHVRITCHGHSPLIVFILPESRRSAALKYPIAWDGNVGRKKFVVQFPHFFRPQIAYPDQALFQSYLIYIFKLIKKLIYECRKFRKLINEFTKLYMSSENSYMNFLKNSYVSRTHIYAFFELIYELQKLIYDIFELVYELENLYMIFSNLYE